MIEPVVITIAAIAVALGVIFSKNSFFALAKTTLTMLNAMLASDLDDDELQQLLIRGVGGLLKSLFVFLIYILCTAAVGFLILWLYASFFDIEFSSIQFDSWMSILGMLIGGTVPFIVASYLSKEEDYSPWSKLLHHMSLDNYNVSKAGFRFEKSFYAKDFKNVNNRFVAVTGLARAGTTAMTKQLHSTGSFYSLSYSNMPFLLLPNLWKKLFSPKQAKETERAHGDRVMVGVNSIEALDEFFFKAHLNDSYIGSGKLSEHALPEELISDYYNYQTLVGKANGFAERYITKNNNLMLRYQSLRKQNSDFDVILMFRDPLSHAHSLLKQHQQFSEMQRQDPFVLKYMDWLGHHEFGLNHMPFEFSENNFQSEFESHSINYWLDIWMNYYNFILSLESDKKLYKVSYQDFLEEPNELLKVLEYKLEMKLNLNHIDQFVNTNQFDGEVDEAQLAKAHVIYNELLRQKLSY